MHNCTIAHCTRNFLLFVQFLVLFLENLSVKIVICKKERKTLFCRSLVSKGFRWSLQYSSPSVFSVILPLEPQPFPQETSKKSIAAVFAYGVSLGFCCQPSIWQCLISNVQGWEFNHSLIAHSFILLKSNEQLLAIRSDCSRKMSVCERIAQVAQDK